VSRDDFLFPEDIEKSCRKVISFVEGYTFDDFLRDEKTFDATVRNPYPSRPNDCLRDREVTPDNRSFTLHRGTRCL